MILLNFSHPLTPEQRNRVQELAHREAEEVADVPVQIDPARALGEQAREIVDRAGELAGLTAEGWQTERIIVNLPGYAPAAAAVLAELHGRMGHFPAILWVQAVPGAPVPEYRVAEIVNLDAIRSAARVRRSRERSDPEWEASLRG